MAEIEPSPDITDRALSPGTETVYSVETAWKRVDAGKQDAATVNCEVRVRFTLPVTEHFDTDGCLARIGSGIGAVLGQVGRSVTTATGRDPLR